jgi:hypothetical protein
VEFRGCLGLIRGGSGREGLEDSGGLTSLPIYGIDRLRVY